MTKNECPCPKCGHPGPHGIGPALDGCSVYPNGKIRASNGKQISLDNCIGDCTVITCGACRHSEELNQWGNDTRDSLTMQRH